MKIIYNTVMENPWSRCLTLDTTTPVDLWIRKTARKKWSLLEEEGDPKILTFLTA